jgi:hypothetical protein
MTTRTYSSPEAFKQALEQRLRSATNAGAEFARKRQLLVFDRFLARDVDPRLMGSPDDISQICRMPADATSATS